jgi:hypothetical protein
MLIYSAVAGLTYIVVFFIFGGSKGKDVSQKSKVVKTNKTTKREGNEQVYMEEAMEYPADISNESENKVDS